MGNKVTSQNYQSTTAHQQKEIFVQLLSNEILHKFADVIVAFVDTSWNSNDEILQGLARIGGNMFVSEWNKIRHQKANNCQVGDIFCVQPGGLPCRHLLFAVWREEDATETSDVNLNFVVENMLERTKSLDVEVSSIAVPLGCGMNVETHVKILNCAFLWLMALSAESTTHIHFLASNQVVEQNLEMALQGFKDFTQQKLNEELAEEKRLDEDLLETDAEREKVDHVDKVEYGRSNQPLEMLDSESPDESSVSEDKKENSVITTEVSSNGGDYYPNGTDTTSLSHSNRCDEYPFNTPRTISRMSSEYSDEGLIVLKKIIDIFPETESIWKYYTGSKDEFASIIKKGKPRSVQFKETVSDLETERPVVRTLSSQSSMDEVPLDYINFEPKRKRRKPKPQPPAPELTLAQQDETSDPTFFCSICQSEKDASSKRILPKCGHEFCTPCIDKYFEEISPSCPNCKEFYGKPLGNQPYGVMSYRIVNQYLPGHPGTDTIIIEYDIPNGIQTAKHPNPGVQFKGTHRTAYLPDSEQGRKVHRMLQKAFDQHLIFTVGKSATTGRENVVRWNDIHHKTRPDGGPERYGYPDPEYLDRVIQQLKNAGIPEEED